MLYMLYICLNSPGAHNGMGTPTYPLNTVSVSRFKVIVLPSLFDFDFKVLEEDVGLIRYGPVWSDLVVVTFL